MLSAMLLLLPLLLLLLLLLLLSQLLGGAVLHPFEIASTATNNWQPHNLRLVIWVELLHLQSWGGGSHIMQKRVCS